MLAKRVYSAFLDPDAMAKWLPPHGFTRRVLQSPISFTPMLPHQATAFAGSKACAYSQRRTWAQYAA